MEIDSDPPQSSDRSILRNASDIFGVVELLTDGERPTDFRLVDGTGAFLELVGLGPEAIGQRSAELRPSHLLPSLAQCATAATGHRADTVELDVEAGHRVGGYVLRLFPLGEPKRGLVAMAARDTSPALRADRPIREEEAHYRFLLGLNDLLLPLTDPVAVQQTAAEAVTRHLGLDRAFYADVAGESAVIRAESRPPDARPLARAYALEPHGLFGIDLSSGATRALPDVQVAGSVDDSTRQNCLAIGVAALVLVPIIRNGMLVGIFAGASAAPRPWTDSDVIILEDVAARTHDAVVRVRSAANRRASEERYRALAEATSDVICRMSPDWHETWRLEGYDFLANADGPVFRWFQDDVPPEDERAVSAAIARAIAAKEPFELEHRVRQADGTVGWAMSRAVPVLDDRGEIAEWIGTATDITVRKRAEEALREREDRYRSLFASMDEGCFVSDVIFDEAGRPVDIYLVDANPAAMRMVGADYTRRRLTEIAPGFEPHWYQIWGEVATTGRPRRLERHADLLAATYDFFVFKQNPDDPVSRRIVNVFQDVTERKRAEQERERDRQMAERAVVARDRFLSIGSHELRTPITALKGTAELMMRAIERGRLDDARRDRYARTILDASARLHDLINDLFDVARLHVPGGAPAGDREPTNLTGLVKACVDELRITSPRHRIMAQLSPDPPLMLDASRIRQVITNLLDNAIKYSPDGGDITVSLTYDDEGATLRVQDEGIGLPAGALEPIFEPFNRAPNAAASSIPGMGLGLYLCREIAEAHGGTLRAESPGEDAGTTMVLRLPLPTADELEAATQAATQAATPTATPLLTSMMPYTQHADP